ncbi:MAG: N-acetylmuramoyl-L-alanine amidase [Myxococcales bacterium]|nr:N-acetylmuramoyl-L-alanine amidase [Myxococcales bacterium]
MRNPSERILSLGWRRTLALGCALCVAACVDAADHTERSETAQAGADPVAQHAATYEAAWSRARSNEGDELGVAAASEAATAAAWLAVRTGERAWWERAREAWAEASRRRILSGACEAGVALARHETSDPNRLREAYIAAYSTSVRFQNIDGDARCVDGAREILRLLAAFRPSDAELAIIDADPNANDPSAHTEPLPPSADVESWIAQEGLAKDSVRVEDVHVVRGDATANGDAVRVVVKLSGVASYALDSSDAGVELAVHNARPAGSVGERLAVGRAGVDSITARTSGTDTVLVFHGARSDGTRVFFLPDPYRIVVDVSLAVAQAPTGPRSLGVVVLDAGHGGDDFGAWFGGLRESRTALDITRRVGGILERRLPETRVIQTRTRDEFISLEERVAFANAASSDVFVSIHLNSGEGVERGGVTTFVLDSTNDQAALRLAARENGTTTREVTGLQQILAGIHRREQVADAKLLAGLVHTGTLTAARMHLPKLPDRGVKSAMFYVLVGATMPAILVEASFINEPEENKALGTEKYRQSLAEGIAEGVVRYARAIASRK